MAAIFTNRLPRSAPWFKIRLIFRSKLKAMQGDGMAQCCVSIVYLQYFPTDEEIAALQSEQRFLQNPEMMKKFFICQNTSLNENQSFALLFHLPKYITEGKSKFCITKMHYCNALTVIIFSGYVAVISTSSSIS